MPKFCPDCGTLINAPTKKCWKCNPSPTLYDKKFEEKEEPAKKNVRAIVSEFEVYISTGRDKREKKSYKIVSLRNEDLMEKNNLNIADFVRCSCLASDGAESKETAFIDVLYFRDHPNLQRATIKREHIVCDRKCRNGWCTFNVDDLSELNGRLREYTRKSGKNSPSGVVYDPSPES
jgi:hypothetical protein